MAGSPPGEEIIRLELLHAAHPGGRIFTHLADAYRKAGELERARETVERGLVRHGEYPSAHVVHGRVLEALGDGTGAARAFRRVLELDGENRVALRGLGELAVGGGREVEALEYYRALLLLDPSDGEVEGVVRELEGRVGTDGTGAAEAGDGVGWGSGAGADAVNAAGRGSGADTVNATGRGPAGGSARSRPESTNGRTAAGGAHDPPVVTETMAELYARQGLHEEAAEVYRALLRANPHDDRLRARVRIAEVCLAASRKRAAARPAGTPTPGAHDSGDGLAGAKPAPTAASATPPAPATSTPSMIIATPPTPPTPPAAARAATDVADPAGTSTGRPAAAGWRAPIAGRGPSPGADSTEDGTAPNPAMERGGAGIGDTRPIGRYFQALLAFEPERRVQPMTASSPAPDRVPLVDLLVGLLEFRDPFFRGGSSLTRLIAMAIGRRMGLGEVDVEALALAALLRDLGRMMLGGKLIQRPSHELTAADRRRIERHVELSLHLLEGIPLPPGVREAVRHHHERWDGRGYPDGLRGASIPRSARILAVADSLAAMISARPYRPPRRLLAAVEELRRGSGSRYDPAVVEALIRTIPDHTGRRAAGLGLRHRTIVISTDQSRAMVLAAKLCGHGYVAEAERDPAATRERMKRVPVELLILSSDLPHDGAMTFLRELRSDPTYAALPVMAVDADTVTRRVELLENGADVCFPRGVSFDELRATLDALRKRTHPGLASLAPNPAASADRSPWYALQGDLRDFPLPWLLQVLNYDGRTAIIAVRRRHEEGILCVEAGILRHARDGAATGEEALRRMLRWKEGRFVVRPGARTTERTVDRSLMDLLLDEAISDDHVNNIFGAVHAR